MMRRSNKSYSPSAIELAGQRAWNEAWGYHRTQSRRWFVVAAASIAVAGAAVGSACWLAAQSKVVPFLVNNSGPTVETARLVASMPDAGRISGHLRTWVQGFRTVSVDAAYQLRMINQTYAQTDQTSIAIDQVDQWYKSHRPAERAKTETVDVDVQTAIPQGGNVWQVDWKETAWSREAGRMQQVTYWRMIITVTVRIPEKDEEMRSNWDGVFARDFHIQPVIAGVN